MLAPIELRLHGHDGPEVLVLHGGPGAPGSARGLACAIAHEFKVIEPLQRRAGAAPLTMAQHVDDLLAIAPERALLVGWSFGAMLALSYAAAHPSRVRAIALVGVGTYDEASRARYREAMEALSSPEIRTRQTALVHALSRAVDADERDRIFGALGHLAGIVQAVAPIDDDDGAGLPCDEAGYRETWRDALRLQHEGLEPASFSAIHAPVLMLHGEDDPHPAQSTFETLRAVMPTIELVTWPRCGHAPWNERHAREAFVARLCAFLHAHA
ncbi:MAG: alpha/beta hydrolase [Sandaracinaceae bacterium]|nr:alpha/beta hydrolase [Sandaracinaceae bacterium]